MFSHNGKISTRQLMILLILQMFNMNILIMPRIGVGYWGKSGFLAPLAAIILGEIYLLCVTSLTRRFPKSTFVEITTQLLPKWIAYVVITLLAVKLTVSVGLELRMFGELISQIMLQKTPTVVIMIVLTVSAAYLVKSGIEATARMGEIVIFFMGVPLIIALGITIFRVNYEEVLPFLPIELSNVAVGTGLTSSLFVPIEILLMLNGLMDKPQMSRKAGTAAIISIGVLQALITLLCITQNGSNEILRQLWPVIILMKSVGMNNTVAENQEILMLIIWIFSAYMYVGIGIYIISLIGSRTCKFKRENVFVLPIIPIILLVALYPHNLGIVYRYYLRFEYYFGLWFLVPIPLFLLLVAKIRRIKE